MKLIKILHIAPVWFGLSIRIFPNPQKVIDKLLKIPGLDGVQMIPIRGSTGRETGVFLWENAWNALWHWWDGFLHKVGSFGVSSFPADGIVSPNPVICARIADKWRQREIPMTEYFQNRPFDFLEVHPGLDMKPIEISEAAEKLNWKLAYDPFHAIRDYRPDEVERIPSRKGKPSRLGTTENEWFEAVSILAPFIHVIHVHPRSVSEFLEKPTLTLEGRLILRCLQEIEKLDPNRPIILVGEWEPSKNLDLFSINRRIGVAKNFLGAINELINAANLSDVSKAATNKLRF